MKAHEKYYINACKAFGKIPLPVLEDRTDSDAVSVDAYARLIVCIAFKNMVKGKKWIPVYDGSEWHYFVRVWPNASGSGFSFAYFVFWDPLTTVGARLEYRTSELCNQGLKGFKPYYIDFFLLPKEEDSK